MADEKESLALQQQASDAIAKLEKDIKKREEEAEKAVADAKKARDKARKEKLVDYENAYKAGLTLLEQHNAIYNLMLNATQTDEYNNAEKVTLLTALKAYEILKPIRAEKEAKKKAQQVAAAKARDAKLSNSQSR